MRIKKKTCSNGSINCAIASGSISAKALGSSKAATSWENNRQGKMKWVFASRSRQYVDSLHDRVRAGIPPGGRSGAQKTPGGSCCTLRRQRLHLLDGERHDWQAEDLVNIPIRAQASWFNM